MKTQYKVALAIAASFGLGAVAIQGLHAQAKPPIYYVQQIDVSDVAAYAKEYVPLARDSIKAAGGRILSAGAKLTVIEGDPPKSRVAILVWDSMEQLQAWRDSAKLKEARKIAEKYAKFYAFTVEGVVQ